MELYPTAKDAFAAVSFSVKNTGSRPGAEVAQIYVSQPKASLPRPPKELKHFFRVDLNPGQTSRISLWLQRDAFAFYDPAKHDWVVEPGRFEILLGASAGDIRLKESINLPNQL